MRNSDSLFRQSAPFSLTLRGGALLTALVASVLMGPEMVLAQAPKSSPKSKAPEPRRQPPKAEDLGAEGEAAPLGPLEQVEADAQACRTAAEAVQVYRIFLANPKLPAAVRKSAESRLVAWKKMEDENQRRLGKKWVTEEDYAEINRKTDNMIKHSFELLKLRQMKLAKEELMAASRLNPESGKADFVTGLVYMMVARNDLKAAEHFGVVADREPNNPFALNNLAVAEMLTKKYGLATRHFRRALEILPDCQTVADNLGVAIGAGGMTMRHRLPDKNASELNDLYRMAIHDLHLTPYDPMKGPESMQGSQQGGQGTGGPGGPGGNRPPGMAGPGGAPGNPASGGQGGGQGITLAYTIMSPFGRALGKSGGDGAIPSLLDEPDEVVVGIATGTGFVIAPGFVLTNAHVVEGASDIVILDPNDREKQLVATVVATSENPDLALLQCSDLEAPAMPLAETMPRRSTEIMVLGYPGGSLLGLELKSTRGQITSQADAKIDGGSFLFDANVNPGNSGGPVIDQTGKVVGVVVAMVRTNAIGSAYSVGIPMERVWPFLEEHLPETQPATEVGEEAEWADVDERCGPSTVFITAKIKRGGKKKEESKPADDFAQGGNERGNGPPGAPPGGYGPPGTPGAPPPGSIPPGGFTGSPAGPGGPPKGGYGGPGGGTPPGYGPPGGIAGPPPGFGPPGGTPGAPGAGTPPGYGPPGGTPGAPGPGTPPGYGPPGGTPGAPGLGTPPGYGPPGGTPGAPGPGTPPGYGPPGGTPGAPGAPGPGTPPGYGPPGGTPGAPPGAPPVPAPAPAGPGGPPPAEPS